MQGEEEHVTPTNISIQGRIFLMILKKRTSGYVQKPWGNDGMYTECPNIK